MSDAEGSVQTPTSSVWDIEEEEKPVTVGVRNVFSATAIGMIVLTVAITGTLMTSSHDDALQDRKKSNDKSLRTALDVSVDSTSVLADSLMVSLKLVVMNKARTFFATSEYIMRIIDAMISSSVSDADLAQYFYVSLQANSKMGVTEYVYVKMHPFTIRVWFFDETTGQLLTLKFINNMTYISVANRDGSYPDAPCTINPLPHGLCPYIVFADVSQRFSGWAESINTTVWQGLRLGTPALSLPLRIYKTNHMVEIATRSVSLATFFSDFDLPQDARVYAMEDSDTHIGFLLGTSHGIYRRIQPDGIHDPVDVRDPEVDFVVRQCSVYLFQNKWEEKTFKMQIVDEHSSNITGPSNADNTTRSREHWVGLSVLTKGAGLRYWFVMAMPRETVLGTLDQESSAILAEVAASNTRRDDNLTKERTTAWVVICVVCIILMVFSVVVAHLSVNPLNKLQAQMASVAAMELEVVDEQEQSRLSEVNSMQVSFMQMVDKLREYRSYMPEGCLVMEEEDEAAAGNQAPQGDVALVFTDIEGSTALWESCGAAMGRALKVHNEVMRKNITAANGYEVKTIGDAFMAAFNTCEQAISFCCRTQEDLLRCEWPAEVLSVPSCTPEKTKGAYVWNGFRVRMGVHYGPADAEMNPVTGRTDYFGKTVNSAARIEAASIGGAIGVSASVYEQINTNDPKVILVNQGMKTLKGVVGDVQLWMVLPSSIPGRSTLSFKKNPAMKRRASSSLSASASIRKLRKDSIKGKTLLREVLGSVALLHFRLAMMNEARTISRMVNSLLSALDDVLDRTQGLVMYTCGNSTLLSWNVGKPCTQHVLNSLRCCTAFFHEVHTRSMEEYVTWGMSTGFSLEGNVGDKRKFLTVMGWCVSLCKNVALLAEKIGCLVLIAETDIPSQASEGSLKEHIRLVARWRVEAGTMVKIFQYKFSPSGRKWDFPPPEPSETDIHWSEGKKAICTAWSTDSADALRLLCEARGNDTVLNYALRIVEHPVEVQQGIRVVAANKRCHSLGSMSVQSVTTI